MDQFYREEKTIVQPKDKLQWNVIGEEEFREKMRFVFSKVADSLSRTLGPYGSTTVIEKFGDVHITKDGWQVLKKINFSEHAYNTILQMLVNISAQVVTKVGDGSTSSIVAANQILERIEESADINLRPKDFITALNGVVECICEEIRNKAIKIDREKINNEIYKLAYISTNGDEEISRIVQDIYDKTDNPAIEYLQSKTNKTFYEIIDGYKFNASFLDGIYVNNDNGTCELDNAKILMFNYKIGMNEFNNVIMKIVGQLNSDETLVIFAPYYDSFLLKNIATKVGLEMKGLGKSNTVFVKPSFATTMYQKFYTDFSILSGATMITESAIEEINEDTFNPFENGYIGSVKHISIGRDTTTASGFVAMNEAMYDKIIKEALYELNDIYDKNAERNIVTSDLYEAKKRLSKLKCNMGVIHVGGNSHLEKIGNLDLVEDAVKACESAYINGYNMGGNLIIPIVINDLIAFDEASGRAIFTDDQISMLNILKTGFLGVYSKVLRNKYDDEKMISDILDECLEKKMCYNIITDEFTDDIINSCCTDIEILKATSSIISLLISSNQFLSIVSNKDAE